MESERDTSPALTGVMLIYLMGVQHYRIERLG